jgi:hypothetical protein
VPATGRHPKILNDSSHLLNRPIRIFADFQAVYTPDRVCGPIPTAALWRKVSGFEDFERIFPCYQVSNLPMLAGNFAISVQKWSA